MEIKMYAYEYAYFFQNLRMKEKGFYLMGKGQKFF